MVANDMKQVKKLVKCIICLDLVFYAEFVGCHIGEGIELLSDGENVFRFFSFKKNFFWLLSVKHQTFWFLRKNE